MEDEEDEYEEEEDEEEEEQEEPVALVKIMSHRLWLIEEDPCELKKMGSESCSVPAKGFEMKKTSSAKRSASVPVEKYKDRGDEPQPPLAGGESGGSPLKGSAYSSMPCPSPASRFGSLPSKSWFKSENCHPFPGLERFAASTNCQKALQEEQSVSDLPLDISPAVRRFCFELTFRQTTPVTPFWALPRQELVRIGIEAGLFNGLAETLAYLHRTYAAEQERRAIMEEVRKFYLKALSHLEANSTTRKAWAEGPSEIQWWEMLHQIRALVAHESCQPEELVGVDESTPLEEVEARILLRAELGSGDDDDMQRRNSNISLGSAEGSIVSEEDDHVLAYWRDFLQRCPALAAGLNAGKAGPRILTAAKWSYSKNVLFELLAQADELEVWGPSIQCLQEHCAMRVHGSSHFDGLSAGLSDDKPTDKLATVKEAAAKPRKRHSHLSYYGNGPRVALSERVLLAEQEKARKGLLQTVVYSRAFQMQLSLWTPSTQHGRDEVCGQLLESTKSTKSIKSIKASLRGSKDGEKHGIEEQVYPWPVRPPVRHSTCPEARSWGEMCDKARLEAVGFKPDPRTI